MNREKLAWLVSVVLIAMLAFQAPRSLAHRDDDYAFVRTLIDLHRQIATNYVDPVDEQKLQQGAIDGMMGELDPFSVYVPPSKQEQFDRLLEGSFKGVGIQLAPTDDGKIEVVTPIDDSPAFKAGVLAGDVIVKVNGQEVAGQKIDEVVKKIAGPVGTEVSLTVRHTTGEVVTLTMTRQEIVVPTVKGYQRQNGSNSWDYFVVKDPKIAYVRITQFTGDTFDKLKAVMDEVLKDGMKGMILDLRFNPGGRLDQAKEVVNLFVKEGIIVITKGRNRPEEISRAKPEQALTDFPMAVLVNEHSASASEIVAGSLMDNHRALVIGTRTYGKGSVQEVIPMEGGGEMKLTVAYYYLPSGRLVHRRKDATDWGVDPQIVVPMSDEAEKRLQQQQFEYEIFHRPVPKSATRPETGPAIGPGAAAAAREAATTKPTTQPVDVQLDAALSTMIGHIILSHENPGGVVEAPAVLGGNSPAAAAASAPSTRPATEDEVVP